MIQHLQKLPPETLEKFLETREAKPLGIPQKLADYILQVNEARNLHKKFHSITRCAEELQKSYPNLSIPTCKSRIYDSLKILSGNCNVTAEEWSEYFSDMFMKLFEVCLVAKDFSNSGKYLKMSAEYRIKAAASVINPERTQFKHQIVSPDFKLDRMFITNKGLLATNKELIKIISKIETTDSEKKRMMDELKMELNFVDTDYEEIIK
ncbi:MAG: hypothetical protein LBN95_06495 [Prevotellaceae bacterium]|jgi:hypothetical protein|nr:hypothetical protein [Prevotellaceae bacterium]